MSNDSFGSQMNLIEMGKISNRLLSKLKKGKIVSYDEWDKLDDQATNSLRNNFKNSGKILEEIAGTGYKLVM